MNNSKFTSFEELSNVLSNKIDKYGKFGDRLGIQNIRSSLKNEIDELEKSLLEIIESDETNKNKIEEIQYELKEAYLSSAKEIKEKLTEKFNAPNSSAMYHFDYLINNKQIDWRNVNFSESEILQFFQRKFTTSNQTPTFIPGQSTITESPMITDAITIRELNKAITRMKSNTPGIDFVTLDIIKELNDDNKNFLLISLMNV